MCAPSPPHAFGSFYINFGTSKIFTTNKRAATVWHRREVERVMAASERKHFTWPLHWPHCICNQLVLKEECPYSIGPSPSLTALATRTDLHSIELPNWGNASGDTTAFPTGKGLSPRRPGGYYLTAPACNVGVLISFFSVEKAGKIRGSGEYVTWFFFGLLPPSLQLETGISMIFT